MVHVRDALARHYELVRSIERGRRGRDRFHLSLYLSLHWAVEFKKFLIKIGK